ncbi:hypothetical protein A2V61_02670 [Candidatus Woesebacteria bacterium RBG_19FT_COMBO_47_8]|uniref:Uncharacterized protein n=1 Tax=Candidatus Woesebacteria bacterium RBG_13_46_13 TaxID=1802479 RepID=A0A1F7X453_9BACT|nr:MAG: hypothetical protein A2Y68_03505 [Candidatus Woesebacteria bacterium RBG_13_46_13]OGM18113.1 MAG: hypothetical protein A2V61_02670 [Candidatus Woesebacteria bacterium RBG_19FT_COMBO_47_8]HJX59612.1 hypothetical protein [Patescibacteria group bacterium]
MNPERKLAFLDSIRSELSHQGFVRVEKPGEMGYFVEEGATLYSNALQNMTIRIHGEDHISEIWFFPHFRPEDGVELGTQEQMNSIKAILLKALPGHDTSYIDSLLNSKLFLQSPNIPEYDAYYANQDSHYKRLLNVDGHILELLKDHRYDEGQASPKSIEVCIGLKFTVRDIEIILKEATVVDSLILAGFKHNKYQSDSLQGHSRYSKNMDVDIWSIDVVDGRSVVKKIKISMDFKTKGEGNTSEGQRKSLEEILPLILGQEPASRILQILSSPLPVVDSDYYREKSKISDQIGQFEVNIERSLEKETTPDTACRTTTTIWVIN